LEDAAALQDGRACQDACFRLLYRLTATAQIDGAKRMVGRYAPIFAQHLPEISWPEDLLADLSDWVRRFGRRTSDPPAALDPGDANFLHALDGLLLAATARARREIATMACAYAVVHAIEARAGNVWVADDPEAVAAWRALMPDIEGEIQMTPEQLANFAARTVIANAPAQAARLREWREFAAWLRGPPAPEMEPITDQAAEDRALEAWSVNERLLPRCEI
jgi:hypothetical protein